MRKLQQLALTAGIYQKDRAFVVDVNLQVEQIEVARPAFQPYNLAPPPGLNRIVFNSR